MLGKVKVAAFHFPEGFPLFNTHFFFFFFRFLLNPALTGEANAALWKFLGILFGVAIRTKKPLDLHLAPCIWKLIAGMELKVEDLEEVRQTLCWNIQYRCRYCGKPLVAIQQMIQSRWIWARHFFACLNEEYTWGWDDCFLEWEVSILLELSFSTHVQQVEEIKIITLNQGYCFKVPLLFDIAFRVWVSWVMIGRTVCKHQVP